jgi:hypothetical protein
MFFFLNEELSVTTNYYVLSYKSLLFPEYSNRLLSIFSRPSLKLDLKEKFSDCVPLKSLINCPELLTETLRKGSKNELPEKIGKQTKNRRNRER